MTTPIIISVCLLLLAAYLFDLTSTKTRIPSVILLLLLGWCVRELTRYFQIPLPDLRSLLPFFGTIGLVLIVLEGALELELDRTKLPLVRSSFAIATVPMVLLAFLISALMVHFGHTDFKSTLLNTIPLCVISSAIAIPTVRNMAARNKEFVVYESSLSDIAGVLFFNFVATNEKYNLSSVSGFLLELILMLLISFCATVGLAILLRKIDHHIKYAPIILLIILIYEASKLYHLPALIFILLFGLFLGNMDALKHISWIRRLQPEILDKEVHKFKELTTEATFIVRSLFFLLFGYLIRTSELLNEDTFTWAVVIVAATLIIRGIALKIMKLPLSPLIFIAPRGLITILLFLSVAPAYQIQLVNNSLIIQVILLMAFVMMFGVMAGSKKAGG